MEKSMYDDKEKKTKKTPQHAIDDTGRSLIKKQLELSKRYKKAQELINGAIDSQNKKKK